MPEVSVWSALAGPGNIVQKESPLLPSPTGPIIKLIIQVYQTSGEQRQAGLADAIFARVIPIDRKKTGLAIICLVFLFTAAFLGYQYVHTSSPVRIGILLPLTGDVELREPLEWAKENINSQGGIGGRPVELVYRDTGSGNTTQLAHELIADDSIRIVIGPPTSDDVFVLAPEFIEKKKLLISPLATSGDIIRAFGKKGYFWRTTQGDVAQVRAILAILNENGARRVALLTENSTYGKTFYEWTGFFATEEGLDLAVVRPFEPGTGAAGAAARVALLEDPDTIVAACGPVDAAAIREEIDRSGKPVKLFLTDAAATPALISTLGPAAEGLEGTSPTADPSSGFVAAYQERFGHLPTDYAAPAYDAVLLAAYTSARQDAVLFESPADSLRHVVSGNGTSAGWDARGSRDAIALLREGKSPDISGASGPLAFDTEFGVDPLVTYYSRWRVNNGTFRTLDITGQAKHGEMLSKGESVARSHASGDLMNLSATAGSGKGVFPVNRTGLQAVIVGPSRGWQNYRHESDALAMYTMLRENGVRDDNIILMLYDDIPLHSLNPIQGDVHNIPGGKNLRYGAGVDYSGDQVNAETLADVLAGKRSEAVPVVLGSNASTDVFVYIAGHGSGGEIDFAAGSEPFTAEDFSRITGAMERDSKYRRIVFVIDTCFGESIAANATAGGLLYLTGSAANEPSFGAVYDSGMKQWLSDEFTTNMLHVVRADPGITFRELYVATYEKVMGSHVRMLNAENFGDIDVPVSEFLKP